MAKKNERLREAAYINGVRLWEIAARFGISEVQFTRWLREDFSPEREAEALRYINEIAAERRGGV